MKYLISILLFISSLSLYSQRRSQLSLADSLYNSRYYFESIKFYTKVLDAGNEDKDVQKRILNNLCRANFELGNYSESYEYINDIIKNYDPNVEDYLLVSQILIRQGLYDRAKKGLLSISINTKDSLYKQLIASCDSALKWQNNIEYNIVKLSKINSIYDEVNPIFQNGILIFSSSKEKLLIREKSIYNGTPSLQIYSSEKYWDKFRKPKKFNTYLSKNFNLVSFNHDLSEAYFTGYNEQTSQLELIKGIMLDGKLEKTEKFKFNADTCSFAQFSISPSGNVFYFVSDILGGYGGSDIYYCYKENGKWSKPINMGPNINTKGNELFPYSYDNQTFYYSTNGKVGMGGYDIFKVKLENFKFVSIENLKFPINSAQDDLSINFEKTTEGYICSNRKQSSGGFDIFKFIKR